MSKDENGFKPHLTIVGGQPRNKKQKGKMKVPVGMEKILFHASRDEEFRKKLLSDREIAIAQSGIRLRPSEEAMLKVISNTALEIMIANIVPENPRRRKFMGLVAAAAASLAAGTAGEGCGDDVETEHPTWDAGGNGSDTDVDGDTDSDTDTDTDTDSDSDTDSDTDTDTDTDTDSDSDTETGEDAGNDGSVDTDTVDTDEPDIDAGGNTPDASIDGIEILDDFNPRAGGKKK